MLFDVDDEESHGLMMASQNFMNITEANESNIKDPNIKEAKKKKGGGTNANDLKSDGSSSAPEHSDEDNSSNKSGKFD